MNSLSAQPRHLKQVNLSLIRKILRNSGTATRAELAEATRISSTTIRSLLSEMMADKEVETIGYDQSDGGRKAIRYRLSAERYHCAAFCLSADRLYALLVNIHGEIISSERLDVSLVNCESAIFSCLDRMIGEKDIRAVGIGVPGIVKGGLFFNGAQDQMRINPIGDVIARRYHLPVLLENDVNATMAGFGRCYEKEFPSENPLDTNMAYLHFEKNCISAGFISGGKILRGAENFAGELSFIPMENCRTLCQCLAEASDDIGYADLLIRIISWICAILNPQYVALGGPALRKNCIGPAMDGLSTLLPEPMLPELLYSPDTWHDYIDGMAYLTAGKIFDEIHLTAGE